MCPETHTITEVELEQPFIAPLDQATPGTWNLNT
jgi:hypothetical protein